MFIKGFKLSAFGYSNSKNKLFIKYGDIVTESPLSRITKR